MKCPFCNYQEDKVIDSRSSKDGQVIRRRRECLKCESRFTTYERIEESPIRVVKKDGSREPFDRRKILSGLMKACEKRPVSMDSLEEIVARIEHHVTDQFEREVPCQFIGRLVMRELRKVDQVAYVRFASVYRDFKDVTEFNVARRPREAKRQRMSRTAQGMRNLNPAKGTRAPMGALSI